MLKKWALRLLIFGLPFLLLNCVASGQQFGSSTRAAEGNGGGKRMQSLAEELNNSKDPDANRLAKKMKIVAKQLKSDGKDLRPLQPHLAEMEKYARKGDFEAADRALLDAVGEAYNADFWKKVSFKSTDGFTVYGYLNTPKQGKYPIIVLVHGGEHGSADSYQAHALRFVKDGFGSLAVDYRGSSGHGDAYKNAADPAGKEIDDVIEAVEYAKNLGGTTKVGLMGSSHGAFIGGNVITRTHDISAANLNFGGYNFVTLIQEWQNSSEPVAKQKLDVWAPVVADQSAGGSAEVKALSPIYNVSKIDVPVLLIHGKGDKTISYQESVDFYNELKKSNKSVSLKLYDSAPHGFIFRNTEDAMSAYQTTERFFKDNLR